MLHQDDLFPAHEMLRRPRLHDLIHEGLQRPLLMLLAGPGYGKTQAVTACLAESGARVLWLRLGSLDNIPPHFWDRLLRALAQIDAALSARLRALEFPDSLSGLDAFMRILSESVDGREQVIWVFDDFGEIHDARIESLFRTLADMELEQFHLVLLSNNTAHMKSFASINDSRFLISAEDLRFSQDEISALYGKHGVMLEPDVLRGVAQYTEGWPLALHLLALQRAESPEASPPDGILPHQAIPRMFEEQFFSGYTQRQQDLLVRLSLLNSFSMELAGRVYEGSRAELAFLGSHAFVKVEPARGRLFFHHLYRAFLREKAPLLGAEAERQLWEKAAEYYAETGHPMEAIDGYRKCGDHIRMLEVIVHSAVSQFGVSEGTAAYFLEHLDLLTPEESFAHPIADGIRALIYMLLLQLDRAEALLLDVEKRLLHSDEADARALLGEVHISQGLIHMMQVREDFGSYFKKAVDCLPNGSVLSSKTTLKVHNNHSFYMPDKLPGAKERMERAMHEGVPWFAKVTNGCLSGMENVFSSELCYLAYDLQGAQQYAYRAIHKAKPAEQHDLVCNAYCILARIGLLQGNFAEMSRHIQNIVQYAEQYRIGILDEIRDTALAWYYIQLQEYERVPKSIITMNDPGRSPLVYARVRVVYIGYLLSTGEYQALVDILETLKGVYPLHIRQDTIYLYILLAIGHYYLGNEMAAVEALWGAYDMCYNNGLTTLFIETGRHMRNLIRLARQQSAYTFADDWLDLIEKEATGFSRRAETVRVAYRQQNAPEGATVNPLSKRERDILQALSLGLTRDEISVKYYLSVNTVKACIRGIHAKLNASNRAEAVSIAIAQGFIDGVAAE